MNQLHDIIVVGAGPGGTSAAFYLARAGCDVLLIDKETFPRDKICAGAISPRSLKILEEILSEEELQNKDFKKIKGARIHSPNGRIFEGEFPKIEDYENYGYIIPRIILDNLLLKSALNSGVKFINSNVTDLIVKEDFICGVIANNMPIRSKITILASGANSVPLKESGHLHSSQNASIVATKMQFSNVKGVADYVELYYDKDILPAYFWFFPEGEDKANIGYGIWENQLNGKSSMDMLYSLISKNKVISKKLESASCTSGPRSWLIPFRNKYSETYGNGVLVVGDAAGFANPLTGEGICYALESGKMAAETTVESLKKNDFSSNILKSYEEMWKSYFEKDREYSYKFKELIRWPFILNFVCNIASRNYTFNQTLQGIIANLVPKQKFFKITIV